MSTNPKLDLNAPDTAPIIDIRYGQVGLVQVRLRTTDPGAIIDELSGRVATAPHFFRRTAVCLDLSALERVPGAAELRAVIDAVRRVGMLTIGLVGNGDGLEPLSVAVDVPIVSSFRPPARTVPAAAPLPVAAVEAVPTVPEPEPEPAPAVESSVPALLHNQAVRSGQRIYARHRDLIVTAGVAAGAEVMADGCLHVYGSLRGRAMAGVHGDLAARVFCQEFYAELVSIAGVFRIFEKIPPELLGKPVQVWLAGEDLHCARISG